MSDLDAAGSPSIALPRPEESGAQHLCQDAESLEGQRSGRVYFNGLSGPLDPSMDKMTLQEAPSCLYGVRLHFHQKRGVSFFAVKVFISSRDTEVIDRNATYTDLGEPEDFFVVLANPGTEKAKDLFDAAEAPREDEALPKLEKALEEVHANVLDARGETAACKACRCGHVRMLYSLQLALADFTLADSQGASPLFLACQEGHVQCARFLLELCGTKKVCIRPDGGPEVWVDFVDRPLNSDATSLYVASQNGHRGTVQLLIQYRAKVNQATRDKATPLFIASQMGFTGIVDDLIEANASVDAANNTGATPLFIASQNARLEIAQKLIALGADVNSETSGGATPMYIAAQKDNKEEAKLLVANKANVNKQAQDGATPLLIAAQNGNLSTVEFLLSLEVVQKDLCMNSGASPIFVSAQNNHLDVVKALVGYGSDVTLCLRSGVSPVYIAAQNGNLEVLKYLLQEAPEEHGSRAKQASSPQDRHGREMLSQKIRQLLDKPAVGEATPLFIACQNGHDKVVALLLDMKAVYTCTEDGSSPLLVAAQNGHLPVVKVLWQEIGEDVGLNRAKRGGATPLYIACQNGHLSVVQMLIELRAEVNKSLQTLETPLFIACQGGFLEVVRVLVESKAKVNEAKQDGASPLYIACQNGHVEVVRYLLCPSRTSSQKPDKDLANSNNATPLFIASQKGHEAIVELLLREPSAQVDKPLKSGATPFYIAALKGHAGVISRLRESGAALNSTPKHGATPVSAAVQNDHLEVLKLLIKMGSDVSIANVERMTPLHYGAQGGKLEMVELLLQALANVSAQTRNGKSALELAEAETLVDDPDQLPDEKAVTKERRAKVVQALRAAKEGVAAEAAA